MRRKERKSYEPVRAFSEADSGLYVLILRVGSRLTTKIGAIGRIDFKPGYYAYCGRARRNLSARLARHFSRRKKMHWHIDYLTCRKEVTVESAKIYGLEEMTECALSSLVGKLPRAEAIHGFGSSDCKCGSHLTFLGVGFSRLCLDSNGLNG